MAGAEDGDAVVVADRTGGSARADTSADAFADDPAAAHDDRRRAAAGTDEGVLGVRKSAAAQGLDSANDRSRLWHPAENRWHPPRNCAQCPLPSRAELWAQQRAFDRAIPRLSRGDETFSRARRRLHRLCLACRHQGFPGANQVSGGGLGCRGAGGRASANSRRPRHARVRLRLCRRLSSSCKP